MTSLIAPRYELPLVDDKGRVSREWYKFLVNLSKSVDNSSSSSDDVNITQESDLLPIGYELREGGKGQVTVSHGGDTMNLNATAFANPSASAGLTAVNGTAVTAMRSDAAPVISQAIIPTWSDVHTFQKPLVLPSYTVAGLPTATQGSIAMVTDSTTTAITGLGLAPVGGGANKVIVYATGAGWIIL